MEGTKEDCASVATTSAATSKRKCQHLLSALLQLEQRYSTSTSNSSTVQHYVLHYSQTTMRQSIVIWYQQIITSIDNEDSAGSAGLPRDVSFIAIRLLDRIIPQVPSLDPSSLKCIAFTCLYVAIKIHYKKCGLMNTEDERRAFLELGQGGSHGGVVSVQRLLELTSLDVSEEQIKATELWMLQQVNWSICPLTPGLFMKCIIPCTDWTQLLRWDKQDQDQDHQGSGQLQQHVLETSLMLGELATSDSFFIPYNVSAIALTCVIAAASIETQQDSSSLSESVLQAFAPSLKHTVEELQELHVLCLKLFQLYYEQDGNGRGISSKSSASASTIQVTSSTRTQKTRPTGSNRNNDELSISNNGHSNNEPPSSNDSTASSSSSSSMMNISMDTSSLEENHNDEPNVDDDDQDDVLLSDEDNDTTRAQQHHHQMVLPQQPQQRHAIASHHIVHVIPYEHNEI